MHFLGAISSCGFGVLTRIYGKGRVLDGLEPNYSGHVHRIKGT